MWIDSIILKITAIAIIIAIAILIWSIVRFVKREYGEAIVGLIVVICLGLCPIPFIRGHVAAPVISKCEKLPDGRFVVQDSTRHCYECADSTQVFTAIIGQEVQLFLFDTCISCHKTLFDHETKQHTEQELYAQGILPSAPWE